MTRNDAAEELDKCASLMRAVAQTIRDSSIGKFGFEYNPEVKAEDAVRITLLKYNLTDCFEGLGIEMKNTP